MENNFKSLGISEQIVKNLDAMGFTAPTKVQEEAIPHILDSKDLIVMSKTGSGKTGAFGIPVIQSVDKDSHGPQALILTPTRELAVQVDSEIKKMSKNLGLKSTAVYGQHNIEKEIDEINRGAKIISGTPGRVIDHISRKTINTREIKFVVLDEADRMLDMGFIDQVVKIIRALPKKRVTLLFSATMPAEIQKICREYMIDPETIELETDTKTVDSINQEYFRVEPNRKRTELKRLLKVKQPDSCMVFCNTRYAVDKVAEFLTREGFVCGSIHGANTQSSRMKTIDKLKKGQLQILVATDVAARGIHIDDLTLVINYDVPIEKDSYVHRIGRTGRAGNGGEALTLVTGDELMSFYEIEEHVGVRIYEEELPTDEQVYEATKNPTGRWAHVKPTQVKTYAHNKFDSAKKSHHHPRKPSHGKKPVHGKKPFDHSKPLHEHSQGVQLRDPSAPIPEKREKPVRATKHHRVVKPVKTIEREVQPIKYAKPKKKKSFFEKLIDKLRF